MDLTAFTRQLDELFELDPGTVQLKDALHETPGWNSLTFMGLIALVDEEYGVTLAPKAVLNCVTVHDLARLIDGGMASERKSA